MDKRDTETLDDLQRAGYRIFQQREGFRFGTDAVLLADFCRARTRERVVDAGSGTGVIAILLAARVPSITLDAIELREQAAALARRSVAYNGLSERVRVHALDLEGAWRTLGCEWADLVVTNPPYLQAGQGLTSPNAERALARGSETTLPIEAWIAACGKLLRSGGRLCMVFPAEGLLRLTDAMRACRIEPKRLRSVSSGPEVRAKRVLLEGRKHGKPGLTILPTLITHEDGRPSAALRRIYGEPQEG